MTNEEAISNLICCNELMLFEPTYGTTITVDQLNEMNRDLYNANLVAIQSLEENDNLKAENERLKEDLKNERE